MKVKVKFVRNHPFYAYSEGDEAELSAETVLSLTASGYVVPVKTQPETAALPKAETATLTRKK